MNDVVRRVLMPQSFAESDSSPMHVTPVRHLRSTSVPTIRRPQPTIPASVRWLVWPEMDDKAAERANGDTQENCEN
jgi:hypothetical protein